MKKPLLCLFLLALAHSHFQMVFGSEELDQKFAVRKLGTIVIESDSAAVFAEQIQRTLEADLSAHSRFDVQTELLPELKEATSGVVVLNGFFSAPWARTLKLMEEKKLDALVAAHLVTGSDQRVALKIAMFLPNGTVLFQAERPIQETRVLSQYIGAAKQLVADMEQSLLFEGTVLNRHGYNVVIDHGYDKLRPGQKITAYTVESQEGQLGMVETGIIEIVNSESKISFGKVIVEKVPLKVATANKVRFSAESFQNFIPLIKEPSRRLSSLSFFSSEATTDNSSLSESVWTPSVHSMTPQLASLEVDFAGTYLTWNTTSTGTAGVGSNSAFYPGVNLKADVWLTKNWYLDVGFQFAMASLTGSQSKLNSKINQTHLIGGYRFKWSHSDFSPWLSLKAGYCETRYSVDNSSEPLAPVSGTYSGIRTGVELGLPLKDDLSIALSTDFLLLPKYSQDVSVNVRGVSVWEFGLFSNYLWSEKVQFTGGIYFQAAGVDTSSSAGTFSLSQNQRRLGLGMKYLL